MADFKEIVMTPQALSAWEQSPRVSVRAAQLKGFAEHQELSFDPEGMTRMLAFNIALNQTQGSLPDLGEFMPGR